VVQGYTRGALYENGGARKRKGKAEWTIVRNTHEPIISQELFEKANAVLNERSAASIARLGKYDYFETPPLLLRNLLFCADCGRPLRRCKNVSRDGEYVRWTYRCYIHDRLGICLSKNIGEPDLYNAVFEAIRIEIQKCCDISGIISKLNRGSSHKLRLARFDADIMEAERELTRLSSLKQAVYDEYAAKLLTQSEYLFAAEKYNTDAAKQQARLEAARRDKAAYTQDSTPTNKWLAAFSRFSDAKEFTAEMAQALLERVEVSDLNRVTVRFKFRDEYAAICGYAEEA
jgi:hypothetical protein